MPRSGLSATRVNNGWPARTPPGSLTRKRWHARSRHGCAWASHPSSTTSHNPTFVRPNEGSNMTEVADRPSDTTFGTANGGQPSVDVAALGEQLLGKWADIRRQARELAAHPELHKIEGLTHTEHRQRTFGQLRYLVDNGGVHRAFPADLGGSDDHGGNIAG